MATDEGILRGCKILPKEIRIMIAEFHSLMNTTPAIQRVPADRHPGLTPPANGASPFMTALPTELRRAIVAASLPAKDVIIEPRCENDVHTSESVPQAPQDGKKCPPKRNPMSDLMTVNKTFRDEVTEAVYEERTFALHVHEGIRHAGIEFLQEGRQPLHWQWDVEDPRFTKFADGDAFGFNRLRKIKITIFPSVEETSARHTCMNTYFINLALCRLLQRSAEDRDSKDKRITHLTIDFALPPKDHAQAQAGRHAIMGAEDYWWDADRKQPKTTSIHGLSNIEIVLRPFGLLKCHNIDITLPPQLQAHVHTVSFVSRLSADMTSLDKPADDGMDNKIECFRQEMEDYVNRVLYGGRVSIDVPGLTAEELQEDEEARVVIESSNDKGKHGLSRKSSKLLNNDEKRRKIDEDADDEVDDVHAPSPETIAQQRVLLEICGEKNLKKNLLGSPRVKKAVSDRPRFPRLSDDDDDGYGGTDYSSSYMDNLRKYDLAGTSTRDRRAEAGSSMYSAQESDPSRRTEDRRSPLRSANMRSLQAPAELANSCPTASGLSRKDRSQRLDLILSSSGSSPSHAATTTSGQSVFSGMGTAAMMETFGQGHTWDSLNNGVPSSIQPGGQASASCTTQKDSMLAHLMSFNPFSRTTGGQEVKDGGKDQEKGEVKEENPTD